MSSSPPSNNIQNCTSELPYPKLYSSEAKKDNRERQQWASVSGKLSPSAPPSRDFITMSRYYFEFYSCGRGQWISILSKEGLRPKLLYCQYWPASTTRHLNMSENRLSHQWWRILWYNPSKVRHIIICVVLSVSLLGLKDFGRLRFVQNTWAGVDGLAKKVTGNDPEC